MTADVLDNAVWHSLRGAHSGFAEGDGTARRYAPDVSVFHGAADDGEASWQALADVAHHGVVVVFRALPISPPAGWEVLFDGDGHQMVLDGPAAAPDLPSSVRPLTAADVSAMTSLVALTEPGPWRPRTIELGGYVGLFDGDELVAMAGQRLRPPGWCEISAVCTRPEVRRRGYASLLTRAVAAGIAARGERAMLHVAADNTAARAAYERLGFAVRTAVRFSALRVPLDPSAR